MAISKHTPALFNDGLPDPRLQQFRMRRLQVHNWGTFNGLTEVPIAERGFLFVGRSGLAPACRPFRRPRHHRPPAAG
ncbi:ATP-binding protein, partial [Stenotrophomonas sp. NPDC077659]|uniref:ATP-binding protein n=1 Tax=Stenotrophomonas sp. NPDC077659 TaxID=3390694 RepID=UPI003D020CA5